MEERAEQCVNKYDNVRISALISLLSIISKLSSTTSQIYFSYFDIEFTSLENLSQVFD